MGDPTCNECGAAAHEKKTIELRYRRGDREIVAKDVPAEVCSGCGMAYLEPAILREIEKRLE